MMTVIGQDRFVVLDTMNMADRVIESIEEECISFTRVLVTLLHQRLEPLFRFWVRHGTASWSRFPARRAVSLWTLMGEW